MKFAFIVQHCLILAFLHYTKVIADRQQVGLLLCENPNDVFVLGVQGGSDQLTPVIVSRVAPNTPADLCLPRLSEGDQVLFINGRDISQHTHAQVRQAAQSCMLCMLQCEWHDDGNLCK